MEFEEIIYNDDFEIEQNRYLSLYSNSEDSVDSLKIYYNIRKLIIKNEITDKIYYLKGVYSALPIKTDMDSVFEHVIIFEHIEEISKTKYQKIIYKL